MSEIAVVVPTIRQDSYEEWLSAWEPLFSRHAVYVVTVFDGRDASVQIAPFDSAATPSRLSLHEVMGDDADLICRFTPAVRNLGFAAVAKLLPNIEYIVTLDDDTAPEGDTIEDHLRALQSLAPISWLSLCSEYMRGFPYGVRTEAPVMVSHGLWAGCPDWDAPTQLTVANSQTVRGACSPIPRGIFAPLCGMNIAFRRSVLPHAYWAPAALLPGAERFDDIWMGLYLKRVCDEHNWAVLSGAAIVRHERASNVFKNLRQEAVGIEINEALWKDLDHPPEPYRDFFEDYAKRRERWRALLANWLDRQKDRVDATPNTVDAPLGPL